MQNHFRQLNGFDIEAEHILLVSKKGVPSYKKKKLQNAVNETATHNRKKNYLLEEGKVIPPLVDMGIFTAEGKIVRTMYDKFKQINRFVEIIDDYVKDCKRRSFISLISAAVSPILLLLCTTTLRKCARFR